ncbi:MAG: hypothetical protein Q7S74_00215 [Nanoarchaeota archaeon]|nr:hypothetical protein [Nanoarchaeota archaeon]
MQPTELASEYFPPVNNVYNFDIELLDKFNNTIFRKEAGYEFYEFYAKQRYLVFNIRDSSALQSLRVTYSGQEKLFTDLKESLCNTDKICEGFEDYYSCPSDCTINAKDNQCILKADSLCDPDCIYNPDCQHNASNSSTSSFWIKNKASISVFAVAIIFLIILLTIVVILLKRESKS